MEYIIYHVVWVIGGWLVKNLKIVEKLSGLYDSTIIHYACHFFSVLAAKSFILVRLRTILSAIANLAALTVLCKRISLGKSNI